MLFAPPLAINDVVSRVAVVQGYNSNTYQAQDDPDQPIINRHPAPYTGLDGQVEWRVITRYGDTHDVRLGGRLLHYEPLEYQPGQSDDAAANFSWISRFTLTPRSYISVNAQASVMTLNGTHVTDGTLFRFDPSVVRRTYWIANPEVAYVYELSKTWRYRQAIGGLISGTLDEPATELPSGQRIKHRGLDFVQPYLESTLFKDLTPRATGDLTLVYQYQFALYVLDLSQTPPRNVGPDRLAFLTGSLGHTYRFTQELINTIRVGGTIASPPPRDPDQRYVLSPMGSDELSYTREFWQFIATAGYTYGSVNPRLGSGPSMSASALIQGTPIRRGHWRDFSVLANVQGNRSGLLTGVGESTIYNVIGAGAEIRYGVNNWLGIMAGYEVRYATFEGQQFVPPFLRHLVFVGLSGYFTTDKTFPTLTTFSPPTTPM